MKVLAIWQGGIGGVEYHRLYIPLKRLLIDHDIEVNVSQEFEVKGLPELKDFDLVLFNRDLGKHHYDILEYMARHSIPYIVDIDDHWDIPRINPLYKYAKKNKIKQKTIDAIRYASGVTCATEELAAQIRPINHKISILPNALDLTDDQWVQPKYESEMVRFGWVGSGSHAEDITLISEDIQRILNDYENAEFWFCGFNMSPEMQSILYRFNGNTGVLHERIKVLKYMKTMEYGHHYRCFDVALAPLQDNKWNACKSELKVIEAAAYGLPVIASKVKPYTNLSDNFGVTVTNDFYTVMASMIENKHRIKDAGEINQSYCLANYDLTEINEKRLAFYENTIQLQTPFRH
jgi:glycosyltransferase involved in cell wall biosynthesis